MPSSFRDRDDMQNDQVVVVASGPTGTGTTNRFAVPSRDWIRSDQPDRGGRRRTFAPLRRKRPL